MRDHDDGVAGARQVLEQRHDFGAGFGIKIAGRFVGQQDGWFVDEGAGDGDALALATGQLVGFMVHAVGQADLGNGLQCNLPPLVGGYAGVNQRQLHVVQRIRTWQQIEGLKHKANFAVADFRQLIVVHLADQNPVEFILPGRGRVEAADQVHQGGFAGAGRAHDGDVFAALDFERHVPQGVDGFRAHLITPRNVLEADQRHG